MDLVFKLVEKYCNGEIIEYNQIKLVVDFFIFLGFDENDFYKFMFNVYCFYFEKLFFEVIKVFYMNESKQFFVENSVVEFMKKVEVCLEEEEN